MELDEKSVKIERLYALHKNVMLYTAERILRDYQLAEDAVQRCWTICIRSRSRIVTKPARF